MTCRIRPPILPKAQSPPRICVAVMLECLIQGSQKITGSDIENFIVRPYPGEPEVSGSVTHNAGTVLQIVQFTRNTLQVNDTTTTD